MGSDQMDFPSCHLANLEVLKSFEPQSTSKDLSPLNTAQGLPFSEVPKEYTVSGIPLGVCSIDPHLNHPFLEPSKAQGLEALGWHRALPATSPRASQAGLPPGQSLEKAVFMGSEPQNDRGRVCPSKMQVNL